MTLSVIIPVYNVAPYLRRCLESVARAVARCVRVGVEAREIEVICVDDGSTDGSGAILDAFAASNPSFVVLHLVSNRGVSAARNAALDIARGEWVGFVDADDAVSEDWFANTLKILHSHPSADILNIATFASIRQPKDLSRAIERAKRGRVRVLSRHADEQARQKALYIFSRYGWPFRNFIRRSCLADVRFPKGVRLKEDVAFFLALSMRVSNLVLADYPGYFYSRREGSALMRPRRDEEGISLARALLELGRKHKNEELWRAITVALGYDFIHWADERDPSLASDPSRCEIRELWRTLRQEGGDHLSAMYFWWRIGIRHWLKTGDIVWARRIRRMREWIAARFI